MLRPPTARNFRGGASNWRGSNARDLNTSANTTPTPIPTPTLHHRARWWFAPASFFVKSAKVFPQVGTNPSRPDLPRLARRIAAENVDSRVRDSPSQNKRKKFRARLPLAPISGPLSGGSACTQSDAPLRASLSLSLFAK